MKTTQTSANPIRLLVQEFNESIDALTSNCWLPLAEGRTVYDERGVPISKYEPSFALGKRYKLDRECARSTLESARAKQEFSKLVQHAHVYLGKTYALSEDELTRSEPTLVALLAKTAAIYLGELDGLDKGDMARKVTLAAPGATTAPEFFVSLPYADSILTIHKNTEHAVAQTEQAQALFEILRPHSSTSSRIGVAAIIVTLSAMAVISIVATSVMKKTVGSPFFWFLLSTIGAATAGYFLLAYEMTWWPYVGEPSKTCNDQAILAGTTVVFAGFCFADLLLFGKMLAKKKNDAT